MADLECTWLIFRMLYMLTVCEGYEKLHSLQWAVTLQCQHCENHFELINVAESIVKERDLELVFCLKFSNTCVVQHRAYKQNFGYIKTSFFASKHRQQNLTNFHEIWHTKMSSHNKNIEIFLKSHKLVENFKHQKFKLRDKRLMFNDPAFRKQWHLVRLH